MEGRLDRPEDRVHRIGEHVVNILPPSDPELQKLFEAKAELYREIGERFDREAEAIRNSNAVKIIRTQE
jgi:hypothetical protein